MLTAVIWACHLMRCSKVSLITGAGYQDYWCLKGASSSSDKMPPPPPGILLSVMAACVSMSITLPSLALLSQLPHLPIRNPPPSTNDHQGAVPFRVTQVKSTEVYRCAPDKHSSIESFRLNPVPSTTLICVFLKHQFLRDGFPVGLYWRGKDLCKKLVKCDHILAQLIFLGWVYPAFSWGIIKDNCFPDKRPWPQWSWY